MQHRTRILHHSSGYTGVCSCGFVTNDFPQQILAAQTINDHEITALRSGVKVTHLEPAEAPRKR